MHCVYLSRSRDLGLLFFALIVAGGAGCGKKEVPVFPVRGTLTIGNQPAPGIQLVFVSTTEPEGERPHATTGEDGTFQLTTRMLNDGAPAGEYKVQLMPAAVTPFLAKVKKSTVTIPADYKSAEKSPLRATVKVGSAKDVQTLDPFVVP